MAKENVALVAFNRGRISDLALARTDLKRLPLSAEIQTNWMPRALGSMMLRPGLGYTGATKSNLRSKSLPFIYSTSDTARLELTNQIMRVWVNDALVTRVTNGTAITNGDFTSDLSGWSDQDSGSAVSSWVAGAMSLVGTGASEARRRQAVSVAVADRGIRHSIRIGITRGAALLRVGSTAGGDEFITETLLRPGVHSLAFTPTADFYIDVFNYDIAATLIDYILTESAGTLELPTPWLAVDLLDIRTDQSGDVIFVACSGYQQRRIERRAVDSWSVVLYETADGPFRVQNTSATTITPSATTGDVTLTASRSLFRSGHAGALFRLTQDGQSASESIAAQDTFSDPIRVTGVGASRAFGLVITGTWSATVTLQYSVAEPGAWVDTATYTGNVSVSFDDALDNQIIYYRIGVKTGDYTSGTAVCSLSYTSGSQTGICRVTGVTNGTTATAAVLSEFSGTTATAEWSEGIWSTYRRWPSSVALYEGRLWWAGMDRIIGSISDAFDSFDDTFEGDAGPISRTIGSGPVATINWMLPLNRLILGSDGSEIGIKSSSLDEILTPTAFNPKAFSTQGSAAVAAVKVDTSGIFVQKSGTRIYEVVLLDGVEYGADDLAKHVPEIGEPGVSVIAVQRQPDTRLHCVRSDGTAAVLIFDRREEVTCWIDIETDGLIEDVVVLPGTTEDAVYYTVARSINGSTVRYHEKWAMESECQGGTVNKQADSFIARTDGSYSAVDGLSHLEGETVVCWADGADLGEFTVSGGAIAIGPAKTNVVVGLGYQARYKSTKLAYAAQMGTALTQRKRISQLGVILKNTHYQGLQYGPDFDNLDDLPLTLGDGEIAANTVHATFDDDSFEFPGVWSTDSRLCLVANAPKPCTILAGIVSLATHDKS